MKKAKTSRNLDQQKQEQQQTTMAKLAINCRRALRLPLYLLAIQPNFFSLAKILEQF